MVAPSASTASTVAAAPIKSIKSETTDCTDGRSCLLEALHGLPEQAYDRPQVIGEWSIRQCLAHLVGWDAWALNLLERAADGLPPAPMPSEREINDNAPKAWQERPISDLLKMLRDVRDQLAAHASQLTDAERDEAAIEIEAGTHISVNDILDSLIEHDLEHTAQIRVWRKTQSW